MKILVAVCGSIAAYRSVDFVRDLKAAGHEIKVLLTKSATEFVSARVFETFLGEAPLSNNTFDSSHPGTDHIATARWADRIVVYGATAHFLAAYRMGLANDFLQTQLLAFRGEVFVMPAMNPSMWTHPATSEHVAVLRSRGVKFLGPVAGKVACGEEGIGHLMPHPEALQILAQSNLSFDDDLPKVLLSMGPMRSRLDSVRFLQNESSGKMGLEILRAWSVYGVRPRVLLGPVEESVVREVESLVGKESVLRFVDDRDYEYLLSMEGVQCDIFFSAAAVLDLAFAHSTEGKLDRRNMDAQVELRSVADFAARFGTEKSASQWLVSFSAEIEADDRALLERALEKKLSKGAEWTLVNRVSESSGPNGNASQAWIVGPDQSIAYLGESRSKREISEQLVAGIKKAWDLAGAKSQARLDA